MNMSPFVNSLWRLVANVPYEVGSWDESGEEYIVKQRYQFEDHVAEYFTCNWKTFVRQLHFYGFTKSDSRGITWSFKHPSFVRGRPDLLCKVKRKALGKGKICRPQESKLCEVKRLKAEIVAYKRNAEAVLKETRDDMMAELMEVKRELSLIKKSLRLANRPHHEEQPLKRRKHRDSSTTFTEVTETDEPPQDSDFFENLDLSGLDGILQQFGDDMIVPRRVDPDVDANMPEMWIVLNQKVNVGARFFASFLNSFVAAARSWYELQSEPVLSKTIPQEYPLRKLQRMLNPATSKILVSSLSADELAHELIIRMGMSDQFAREAHDLSVFEYVLDGEVRTLPAHDFATFLSNIAKAVQKLTNQEVTQIRGQSCPLFDRIQPLLAPFTQKAVLLSQELYRTTVVDKKTAYRLWNSPCSYA